MKYSERAQKANSFLDQLNLRATSKDAFWQVLDDMLGYLYDNFGAEIITQEEACKVRRSLSKNEFHSNKDHSERLLGSPPERFYTMILKYTDNFKEMPYPSMDKFWEAFFRRYKQFSFAEKI